jgi:periplasmic protein TonB
MVIIFSIIAIVLLVSLYDYFSAKNWQQVTSDVRNDVVFKNRNKNYGAYIMRRDYNKRMLLILVGMVGSMGAAYGTFMLVKTTPKVAIEVPPTTEWDTIPITIEPVRPEIKIQKIEDVQSTPEKQNELNELKVTDDEIIDPKIEVDPNIKSGSEKIIGDVGDPFQPIIDEGKKGKGPIEIIDPIDEPEIDVDEEAQFPGGRPKLMEFLGKNLQYPALPLELGIQGKSYFQFVVDKKGEISRIKVLRKFDECPECDAEAKRVISKMPIWKPAKKNGKNVDSYFQMPINFVIQ